MLVNDAWDDVLRSDFLDVCDVLSMRSPIYPQRDCYFWQKHNITHRTLWRFFCTVIYIPFKNSLYYIRNLPRLFDTILS